MTGIADFDWPASGSTVVPGAICENLTSFGGIFTPAAGQTPLSEFLRAGAAGSSGTVIEPYAIQAKFPTVQILDQTEFKETISGQINQLLSLVYALLGLSVIIAIFGVISSSSCTTTSSVIGFTMLARLTRPRMLSARLTSTFSPR
jgi:hypothetical protein